MMQEPQRYEPSAGTLAAVHVVYALHSLSILIGLFAFGASIVGAFIFSWPSVLAVVLNYIFRGDARGTYLETHFSWQIRTFWLAALYLVLAFMVGLPLAFVGVGFFLIPMGCLVLGIWVAWRIAYGWIRLFGHAPLPL